MKTASSFSIDPARCRLPWVAARTTTGALLLMTAWLGAAGARAEDAGKNSGKDYTLIHKSAYTPSTTTRNPFWPIGWVPSAPVTVAAAQVVEAPKVRPEDFVVTSISMDYPPLAVINKRTYSVGDKVPLGGPAAASPTAPAVGATSALTDFVTVRQITDGAVVLDYRGKLMRATTAVSSTGRK